MRPAEVVFAAVLHASVTAISHVTAGAPSQVLKRRADMQSRIRVAHLVALSAIAFLTAGARGDTISGPTLNPSNGHYYYLLSEDTWTNSEQQAVALGGHLTTINDAAENAWVSSTFGSFAGVNRNLWIGYYDQNATGSYSWVSGDSSAYTRWATGEPNFSSLERFTMILSPTVTSLGYWNNYYDASTAPYTGLGGSYPPSPISGVVELTSLPAAVPLPPALWMGASIVGMIGAAQLLRERAEKGSGSKLAP
jgi:hypothetical protein